MRSSRALRCTAWLSHLQIVLLLLACEATPRSSALATPLVATPIESASEAEPEPIEQGSMPALDATLIQQVPEGTIGPYVGGENGRILALWAAAGASGERNWFSARLDAKGAPLSPPAQLAAAPPVVTLARIRATPKGFVALASSPLDSGTRIEALLLGPSGELLGVPVTIAQSPTEVLWLEVLVVGGTPVALWAAMASDSADVYLAQLPSTGAPSRVPVAPVRVLEGATAWQATAFGDGIAVTAASAGSGGSAGSVRVGFVDPSGRPLAQTEVQSGVSLRPELDAARIGESLVVAWVQRDQLDDRIYLAAVGGDSRVLAAPEPAAPFGSQKLFGILPSLDRRGDGVLVWENLDPVARQPRLFQLAPVSSRARLEPRRAELEFFGAPHERPEIVRHRGGIAALTRAPACASGASCGGSSPVSMFVELGEAGAVLATEPLRIAADSAATPDLAWGLTCGAEGCMALAARELSPVSIYGVELRARSDAWARVASWLPETPPRALRMDTLAEVEPLADVASAAVGDGVLVATLTQFEESTPYVRRQTPAPDGKLAPLRARLSVQAHDVQGRARGSAQVISYRARSTGGVALVRAPEDRALLAWTALDKQRPEVFATLLAQGGKPLAQRMLTLGAGDVSAVAAGALPLGFTLAWIAERGEEAQLFATRVSSSLARATPDRQLSKAPGAARALALGMQGAETWIAWVQARAADQTLWLSRLESQGMSRAGEDLQIHQVASGTLISPALAMRAEGALCAWIERPKLGSSAGARASVVELGADGRPKSAPTAIAAIEDPAAIRLFCANAACHGAIDARPPGSQLIAGFDWGPSAAARTLVRRGTAGADPAAFTLADSHVFYADRQRQRGLLRRVEVNWR